MDADQVPQLLVSAVPGLAVLVGAIYKLFRWSTGPGREARVLDHRADCVDLAARLESLGRSDRARFWRQMGERSVERWYKKREEAEGSTAYWRLALALILMGGVCCYALFVLVIGSSWPQVIAFYVSVLAALAMIPVAAAWVWVDWRLDRKVKEYMKGWDKTAEFADAVLNRTGDAPTHHRSSPRWGTVLDRLRGISPFAGQRESPIR